MRIYVANEGINFICRRAFGARREFKTALILDDFVLGREILLGKAAFHRHYRCYVAGAR